MHWTVGRKMVLIGVVAVIGVAVLAANNFLTTRTIHDLAKTVELRNDQINTVNRMIQSYLDLTLAAMDSIIDKDQGEVPKERMDTINSNVTILEQNLKHLEELADTAEEKKRTNEIHTQFEHLKQGIQADLVTLIRQSGARVAAIESDFHTLDDTLDNYGDPMEQALIGMYHSVEEEQKVASRLADLRNTQLGLLNTLARSHGDLMLAAMDSIIDKDAGYVEAERLASIKENVALFTSHLDDLTALADTGEEKTAARFIQENFPKLGRGIQVDLVGLIESRASESQFAQIDDTLDHYGDPIGKALKLIFESVKEEQTEASATVMLRSNQLALLTDLVRTHGNLMLAAMDAIIDRESGAIAPELQETIAESVAFFNANLAGLTALADTEEEKKSAQLIKETFPKLAKGIQEDLKHLIEVSSRELHQIEQAFHDIDDRLDEYGDAMGENLRAIQASVQDEVHEAEAMSEKSLSRARIVGLSASGVTLAVLLIALILISRSIIRPIVRISQELEEGADQVSSASQQVSGSSQSLAEGSSEQAASIEETSSALEEMSAMTKSNADNSSQADHLMKEAGEIVARANASMEELTASMDEISKASEETSKIIKTIDEIAFQTNLLALNAAVEAARAGEAGAGFAVVADEVRNLAMRAAEAARNTAELIEGTVKKTANGTALVNATNEAFVQVADSSAKVAGLVSEIASASRDQAEGIEQVTIAITEMDKVTQQNAANAEESASASEEMSSQAFQMKSMVEQLVSLVMQRNQTGDLKKSAARSKTSSPPALPNGHGARRAKKRALAPSRSEVKPEDVIPLDEDEFKDF